MYNLNLSQLLWKGALSAIIALQYIALLAPGYVFATGSAMPKVQSATDGQENVIAVWASTRGHRCIKAAYYDDDGWSVPVRLSDRNHAAYEPQVAMGSSGHAIAVWRTVQGARHVVQAAHYRFKRWGVPVTLSSGAYEIKNPQIVIDECGDALATWIFYKGERQIIQASYCRNKRWSAPIELSSKILSDGLALPTELSNENISSIWQRFKNEDRSLAALSHLEPLTQTITFEAIANHIFAQESIALQAVASSGLPVSYSVESGPITVDGQSIRLKGSGVATITAHQQGNASFCAASCVRRSFTIKPALPKIVSVQKIKNISLNSGLYTVRLEVAKSDDAAITYYRIYRNDRHIGSIDACGELVFTDFDCGKDKSPYYEIESVNHLGQLSSRVVITELL